MERNGRMSKLRLRLPDLPPDIRFEPLSDFATGFARSARPTFMS